MFNKAQSMMPSYTKIRKPRRNCQTGRRHLPNTLPPATMWLPIGRIVASSLFLQNATNPAVSPPPCSAKAKPEKKTPTRPNISRLCPATAKRPPQKGYLKTVATGFSGSLFDSNRRNNTKTESIQSNKTYHISHLF